MKLSQKIGITLVCLVSATASEYRLFQALKINDTIVAAAGKIPEVSSYCHYARNSKTERYLGRLACATPVVGLLFAETACQNLSKERQSIIKAIPSSASLL